MDTKAFNNVSYGLYVLCANDEKPTGCIINTTLMLTNTPIRMSVTVNKDNYTHDVIMKTKRLSVSVLDESATFDVFTHFGFQSGREVDKFENYENYSMNDGLPYLTKYANAYIQGNVVDTVDLPTHTQFIFEVTDAKILSDIPSATYAYYFEHIKPKPDTSKKKGFRCKICGYVYEGDTLPEDYVCPLCKHGAEDFEPIVEEEKTERKGIHITRDFKNGYTYVGGSEYRLNLFENVYPLADGVSYNSYVLIDDKTVLFDTCDVSVADRFFDNLEYALNGRDLDYVVVHHMEPDHGATLGRLLEKYPKVQIIGTAMTFKFIGQFFDTDITNNKYLIKEGDIFKTENHEFTFVSAPMVHWPEVFMTYDKTDKILFTADAFGSFGALQGAFFTSETDMKDGYYDEARRYYTNIVGKYGPQVMNVLKKASTLDIDMICPLHGLILDEPETITKMIDFYQKWATYTPEVKGVMIAYSSIYGGTKTAAEILANELSQKGVRNIKIYDTSNTHSSFILADSFKYSHLVFASASYNAGLFTTMQDTLLEIQEHNLQNRTVALIQNGSWAPSALNKMKEILKPLKNITYIDKEILITSRLKDMNPLVELADKIIEDMSKEEKVEEEDTTPKKQWKCSVCGYVYEGDELPEDFVCPLCKQPRDKFEEV